MFFGPSAFQLRSKIDKKASPGRSKIKQKIGQHLDPIFDGFWSQLGSILGGLWRPSWRQVGTKCHQNPTPKPIKKLITFWEPSGAILNGFWLPKAPASCVQLALMLALGAKMGPRRPKKSQEAPKIASKIDFGNILVDFWLIF